MNDRLLQGTGRQTDSVGQRASKQRSRDATDVGPSWPPGDSEGTRSDAIEEGCAFTGRQGRAGSDFIWAGSSLLPALQVLLHCLPASLPPTSLPAFQPTSHARYLPTYKDRQAKEGATRHEGCAVPPNEINDNLLAAVPWLGLPSPHLSLPTLISPRDTVWGLSACCAQP